MIKETCTQVVFHMYANSFATTSFVFLKGIAQFLLIRKCVSKSIIKYQPIHQILAAYSFRNADSGLCFLVADCKKNTFYNTK